MRSNMLLRRLVKKRRAPSFQPQQDSASELQQRIPQPGQRRRAEQEAVHNAESAASPGQKGQRVEGVAAQVVAPIQLQRHPLVQVMGQVSYLLDQRPARPRVDQFQLADGVSHVQAPRVAIAERTFAVIHQPSPLPAPRRAGIRRRLPIREAPRATARHFILLHEVSVSQPQIHRTFATPAGDPGCVAVKRVTEPPREVVR